jgi:hypothetical protein
MSATTIETPIISSTETDSHEYVATQAALSSQGLPLTDKIDYEELYRAEKERVADLEAVISASKIQPKPTPLGADVTVKRCEVARAQVGEVRWHRMNNQERLLALGQDPNQDLGFVQQLWGKGADPKLSLDLSKTNMKKYRETKEAARAIGIL